MLYPKNTEFFLARENNRNNVMKSNTLICDNDSTINLIKKSVKGVDNETGLIKTETIYVISEMLIYAYNI